MVQRVRFEGGACAGEARLVVVRSPCGPRAARHSVSSGKTVGVLLTVTDVRGTLPDFLRELHRTVAKALNAAQGEWENLWSAESYHALELGADEDVIDKIACGCTTALP